MRRLLVWVVMVVLLAGCAAPTQPATSSTAQVPVTGPTAVQPNPTRMALSSPPALATMMQTMMPTRAMPMQTMMPTQGMPMQTMMPTQGMMQTMMPTQGMPMQTMMPTPAMTLEPSEAAIMPPPVAPGMGTSTPAPGSASGTTYTVLVGAEDTDQGAQIEAFFPATLHVHVGDTVVWKQNAKEIHTVTFLAGKQTPQFVIPMPGGSQGAVMFNPIAAYPMGPQNGQYDGSAPAGSGIMGMEQGQAQSYSLTFTKQGSYSYVCVVHSDMKMGGTIIVDDPSANIPTPDQVSAQAQKDVSTALAGVPAVVANAQSQVKPDVKNGDGTTTHTVVVGYSEGQVDLMSFFPEKVAVKSGDTVTWIFSPKDMAPHTITFLNGTEEPPLVMAIQRPNGPPILTFDPRVALPLNANRPLTNQTPVNSGVIDPSAPGPHAFSLKIGNLTDDAGYSCLLHDEQGMKGELTLAP